MKNAISQSAKIWANPINYEHLKKALEGYGYHLNELISLESDSSYLGSLLDTRSGIDALLTLEGFPSLVAASLRYNHSPRGGLTLRHNDESLKSQFSRWYQSSTSPLATLKPEIYIHALGLTDGVISGRILVVDTQSLAHWFNRLNSLEQSRYLVELGSSTFYSFPPSNAYAFTPVYQYNA